MDHQIKDEFKKVFCVSWRSPKHSQNFASYISTNFLDFNQTKNQNLQIRLSSILPSPKLFLLPKSTCPT